MKSFLGGACAVAITVAAGLAVVVPRAASAASFGPCPIIPEASVTSLPLSNSFSFTYGARTQCQSVMQSIDVSASLLVAAPGAAYTTVASAENIVSNTSSAQLTATYSQVCTLRTQLSYYVQGQVQYTDANGAMFAVSFQSRPAAATCDLTVDGVSP